MRLKDKVAVVTGAGQAWDATRGVSPPKGRPQAMDLKRVAAQGDGGGRQRRDDTDNIAADSAAGECRIRRDRRAAGRVDVLVNNAACGSVDAFADIADDTWARVIGVNLNGAFYCARAAVRAMKAKAAGRGCVINVASTAAVSGDGPAHYCASKAALMA